MWGNNNKTKQSDKAVTSPLKPMIDNMLGKGLHEFKYKQLLITCSGKVYMNFHKNRYWQHVQEMLTRIYIKTVIHNMFIKELHEFT